MPTIEKIIPKHGKPLEVTQIKVNDVEIFRIDFTRYLNYSRKTSNESINFVVKEEK
jgi:hypothetical protein